MAPLSAGLIAGGSGRPAGELALQNRGEVTVHRENRDLKPSAMESSRPLWIAAFLLFLTCDTGVFGRALNNHGLQPHAPGSAVGSPGRSSRWHRGADAAADRERCADLSAPWQENPQPAPEGNATLLQLRVRPFSPRASRALLFPGKALFSFVRRVYRCCQERLGCSSVKGIPGRLRGGTAVELLLTREILSLTTATRVELHLQLSNPQHLEIRPVLSAAAKRGLPTRYSVWSHGSTAELRVDLLFLLRSLQEAAAGAGGGPGAASIHQVALSSRGNLPRRDAASGAVQDGDAWWEGGPSSLAILDLGLFLGCSRNGSGESCGTVQLLHAPFMAVYYS